VIPPILIEAVRDRKLKGVPVTLLCYLHSTLELGEYRMVKHWAVAGEIGTTRQRVSQALHLLVAEGYLRAGTKTERNVGSYMLLSSRGEAVKQSA
jgi:hypothetical protein